MWRYLYQNRNSKKWQILGIPPIEETTTTTTTTKKPNETTTTKPSVGANCPNGLAFVQCPFVTDNAQSCSDAFGGGICCWHSTNACALVDP